jgi:hypothetical protein
MKMIQIPSHGPMLQSLIIFLTNVNVGGLIGHGHINIMDRAC